MAAISGAAERSRPSGSASRDSEILNPKVDLFLLLLVPDRGGNQGRKFDT
jgi:hypothetical protein